MSVKDILDAVRFLFDLLESAAGGDKESQDKLRDILPPKMHADVVGEAQDKLDREKFGDRG